MADDFLKKYAQLLDPAPECCEDNRKKLFSGKTSSEGADFSSDESTAKPAGASDLEYIH